MAKKKTEILSKRQRQSKQIMHDKEIQIRRQCLMHKIRIIGTISSIIFIISGGIWAWKTNAVSRILQITSDKIYELTVQAGYSVENLYLEGRERTSMEELNLALNINKGTPILRLNLAEIRNRLEKIESIKYAAIERSLPNTLYVRVVEREPVAIWQQQGKIALVDDNGAVINGLDITPYKSLPLIVGEDAPKHVTDLLELLIAQPELAKRFVAAIWVSDRRWNIRLRPTININSVADNESNENIEIRLPERNPLSAWKQLAELQKKQQILDRDLKVIDLRIDGRLFIKLPVNEMSTKTSNSKDI